MSGYLSPARQPWPVDVVVLRRNARVTPETWRPCSAPVQVVFDSSCKIWYVARQDSSLRAAWLPHLGRHGAGAFRCRPPWALR